MTKQIILDANILIRAVLGDKVSSLISQYVDDVVFLSVAEAFADAEKYIPPVMEKRGASDEAIQVALEKLKQLKKFIQIVPLESFSEYEAAARYRLKDRDEDDWLFLALAMRLDCPIWTEDKDFFGSGVPTWTSDRVELFLSDSQTHPNNFDNDSS